MPEWWVIPWTCVLWAWPFSCEWKMYKSEYNYCSSQLKNVWLLGLGVSDIRLLLFAPRIKQNEHPTLWFLSPPVILTNEVLLSIHWLCPQLCRLISNVYYNGIIEAHYIQKDCCWMHAVFYYIWPLCEFSDDINTAKLKIKRPNCLFIFY